MNIDVLSNEDLAELTAQRHPASVSLYVASGDGSAIAHDVEAAQVALRSAANEALNELESAGVDRPERDGISAAIESIQRDREFWGTQARTIAVFAAPGALHAFRLRNELPRRVGVGDRFDVGPLMRSFTFGHRGFVLSLAVGEVRLLALHPDATSTPVELTTLPADAAEVFDTTTTDGRFDRHSADGALGPKVEQRRYCSIVQDAVLAAIGNASAPIVLAAVPDLEPAYREVNTSPALLPRGVEVNPSSLSDGELADRAREVLEEHFAQELATWREEFGTTTAHGRGSTQLSDVARAASMGLIDTLLFDLAWDREGSIDEAGAITLADEAGPSTYGLVDEVVARVLQFGGTVRAVRRDDLPDDSPVAATFRGEL